MTITKTFSGNRYDVAIITDAKNGHFELSALHKNSGRRSSVTNLNIIISEILEPVLKIEGEDVETSIRVSNHTKHGRLVKKAMRCLEDKHWVINYLEKAFDEDKKLGGWN